MRKRLVGPQVKSTKFFRKGVDRHELHQVEFLQVPIKKLNCGVKCKIKVFTLHTTAQFPSDIVQLLYRITKTKGIVTIVTQCSNKK